MKKLKIVTIGGGSGYTPELVEGFIKRYLEMPVTELWLVDVEEGKEKLALVEQLSRRILEKAGSSIQLFTTLNRQEALKDADFVLTQFRIGQMEARIQDENIPLKYETIGQETNGPGELFKAFRTIPVMLDLVKEMEAHCPEAWLINFANPAGMLSEAVLNHSKWTKIISICNGPLSIENDIARVLGVDRRRLYVEFAGLNHLIFAKKVCLDGKDVTEQVINSVADEGAFVDNPGSSDWQPDFLKGLKALPMSYLQYYWKTNEVLASEQYAASHGGSRAVVAQKMDQELFEVYRDQGLMAAPELLRKRGGAGYSEAACDLITSLYTDKRDIQTVNVRNNGAITNLASDVVVEVNCVITSQGPVPLTTGPLPPELNGIIQAMKSYEQVACEAAVTGDYNQALVAMTINPLVSSDSQGKAMLDELLEVHQAFLPQFNQSHIKKGD
ncbi:6-phospho-beta-glucosidase [uncultured Vagococcus sp.]|uniref:6-phospho-beta-glucosidase n=1 Tax=uncultured Vagococcus sp. TaxID=189676 RepID=UPI0028D42650|nr:6-phospho-beta-glucosidase [uncultured Vagococcus sp.]